MGRSKQPSVLTRRTPSQARARQTIETIFEATAQIIERDGAEAVNTNLIAERAGIGIGTLYEYFPNKEAVLIAMARRQLAEDERAVRMVLVEALEDQHAPLALLAIRALAELFQRRPEVRRAIMRVHITSGFGSEHAQPVQEMTELLASRSSRILSGGAPPISPAALFVLTRAVIGVLLSAFQEQSSLLGDPALENELAELIESYIARLQRRAA
jgi:AcrR family transcriptional regulator